MFLQWGWRWPWHNRAMPRHWTVRNAEDFGRIRLSKSFFMRDFLYSEIAALRGMANLPDDPDLAVSAGRKLCETLPLELTVTALTRFQRNLSGGFPPRK